MVGKGNLAVFESTGISETGEDTPTKIVVHACYINVYLYEFFEPVLCDLIFSLPWTTCIVHATALQIIHTVHVADCMLTYTPSRSV